MKLFSGGSDSDSSSDSVESGSERFTLYRIEEKWYRCAPCVVIRVVALVGSSLIVYVLAELWL